MSILDEVAGGQPVDLDSLMASEEVPTNRPPEAAERNRASSTALLTADPMETYQRIMMEAEGGQTYTLDESKREEELRSRDKDMTTVLDILGDPSLPDDLKREAVTAINSDFNKDTRNRIREASLIEPDEGIIGPETPEREAVRTGLAEQLRSTYEYENLVQGLLNQNEVFKDEVTIGKVADFFAFLAPLSVNANASRMLTKMADEIMEDPSRVKAAFLPGSFTKDIVDTLYNIPPKDRMEVAKKFVEIIEGHSGVFFGDDNQFNQWLTAKLVMEEGGYTTADAWIDNITGLLDIVGMGSMIKGVRGGAKLAKIDPKVQEIMRDLEKAEAVGMDTVPVAPANITASANAQKARQMYDLVVKSEGDEISKALYGVNREKAVYTPIMPEPLKIDGSVPFKLVDPARVSRTISPDPDVARAFYDNGANYIPPGEKAAATANIVNNFYNGTGLHLLDNMTQAGVLEGGIVKRLSGVFATTEGGFLKAEEAMDQAKFAFRDFGVTEDNITLMKRVEGEYRPVTLKEATGVDGDYAVKIDVDRQILPGDITSREAFDVKWNLFARLPGAFSGPFAQKWGSLQRMLVDPSSMFRPEISSGAIVGFDRAVRIDKALLTLHDDFAKSAKGLKPEMRGMLWDHIKEANLNGLELSDMDLVARGFNGEAIQALKKWRQAWDTHFYFENADLVRTLNSGGYRLFDNGNARFFAKPTGKTYNVNQIYDPATDAVTSINRKQIDELYEQGGSLAQFRRPVHMDEDVVEWMAVRNTPDEYLRTLNDGDQVLNYRKGYYTKQYKAPKFVMQKVYDKNGNELYEKAVGFADNIQDAKRFIQRKATEQGMAPEAWGRMRDDIKDLTAGSNTNWDVQSAGGRVSQRHRGKQLEDSAGLTDLSESPHMLDPAESAVRSARSLSGRIALRDYIEHSKARVLDQWKDHFPKDIYGRPVWPGEASELKPISTPTEKSLADARSMVEYLNYVESGYINQIDEAYKGVLNMLANSLGNMGATKLEKGARGAAEMQPASLTKNAAFTGYLALNPLRQLVIQPHQSMRLAAYNPAYWFSGQLTTDVSKVISYKSIEVVQGREAARKAFAGKTDDLKLIDFIDDTGLLASVDRSNLVRGPLVDLAESSNRAAKGLGKALAAPRKVGYDLGEQVNQVMHLLNVRNKYLRGGKDLADPAVKDEIHGLSRNLSWDMNMGGDFPYNQNWSAPVMQFAQIPHKAIMQFTSRKISAKEKARLAAMDLLLFGVPGAGVTAALIGEDFLPEDKMARDIIIRGSETVMYNTVLSQAIGRDVDFDFSALSPFQLDGWGDIIGAVVEGGFLEFLSQSPSANILFKEGGPLQEAIFSASRYVGGHFDPYEGHEPETLLSVLDDFAKLSSGWNNFQKARMIMNTGRAVDKHGNVISDTAGWTEAAMQTLGFPLSESSLYFEASRAVRDSVKGHKEEVEQFYKQYQRVLTNRGIYADDPERPIKIMGIMRSVYNDDPEALKLINGWILRDMQTNEAKLTKDALTAVNITDTAGYKRQLRDYMLTKGENADEFMKLFDDMEETRKNYSFDNKE